MILCLDIENTHIFGGVFQQDELILQFRYPSTQVATSDQLGIFFKQVLRENNIAANQITEVAISSVVPTLEYSVRSAIIKYFKITPFFLKAGVKTGLNIALKNPLELGADRIANAIAAVEQFPNQNIVIVSLGTATTFDVVKKNKQYLGGVIMPGIKVSMNALNDHTEKLPPVNILRPEKIIGQTTVANIQSGLYYGHLSAIAGIITKISQEAFNNEPPLTLGTGGFCNFFENENLFTAIVPDLVLHGLKLTLEKK